MRCMRGSQPSAQGAAGEAVAPRPQRGGAPTQAQYRLRHPDRVREANRRFRQANTEYLREYLRAWKAANPEKVAAWHVNRRARMRGAAVIEFSPEELAARLAYFGHSCWMCGEPAESVDHVKPLARGGAHMLCNLRPACVSCNSAKGATWPFAT